MHLMEFDHKLDPQKLTAKNNTHYERSIKKHFSAFSYLLIAATVWK